MHKKSTSKLTVDTVVKICAHNWFNFKLVQQTCTSPHFDAQSAILLAMQIFVL